MKKNFWITNFSDKNVSLGDLGITIPAKSSINLLDNKHYHFNLEQLLKSAENGSIYKKQHLIAVRKIPPKHIEETIQISSSIMPNRSKSVYETKKDNYEELLNIIEDEEDNNDNIK